jgi:hypothetical protein
MTSWWILSCRLKERWFGPIENFMMSASRLDEVSAWIGPERYLPMAVCVLGICFSSWSQCLRSLTVVDDGFKIFSDSERAPRQQGGQLTGVHSVFVELELSTVLAYLIESYWSAPVGESFHDRVSDS